MRGVLAKRIRQEIRAQLGLVDKNTYRYLKRKVKASRKGNYVQD